MSMGNQNITEVDFKLARSERVEALVMPPKYQVVLLNDDYTPMDFVVEVLQRFFYKDDASANKIMMQIHKQGKAVCGVFTREIAETKVFQVNCYAREHQHPLLCKMEEATAST